MKSILNKSFLGLVALYCFQCSTLSEKDIAKQNPIPNEEVCRNFGEFGTLYSKYPKSHYYNENRDLILVVENSENKLIELSEKDFPKANYIQKESEYNQFWRSYRKICSGETPIAKFDNDMPYIQELQREAKRRKMQEEEIARIRKQQERANELERQRKEKLEKERLEEEQRNAEIERKNKLLRRENLLEKFKKIKNCNDKWAIWESDSRQLYPMVEELEKLQILDSDSSLQRQEKEKLFEQKQIEINQKYIGKKVQLQKLFVEDVKADKELNAKGKAKMKEIISDLKKDPGSSSLLQNGDNPITNLFLAFYIAFVLAGCEDCYTPNGDYIVSLSIRPPKEDYREEGGIGYDSYYSGILAKDYGCNKFEKDSSREITENDEKEFPEDTSNFVRQSHPHCPVFSHYYHKVETRINLKGLSKERALTLKRGDTISTNAKIVSIKADSFIFRTYFELRE
jgi:hypothetical protein